MWLYTFFFFFVGKLCFNAASDSSELRVHGNKIVIENSRVSSPPLFHHSPSLHLSLSLSDIAEQLPPLSLSLSLSLPLSPSLSLSLSALAPFRRRRSNASSTLYFNLAAVKIKYLKTDIHDFCISQID